MLSPIHATLAMGTTQILHVHFKKGIFKKYGLLIRLDDIGNTREVFQEQIINIFCLLLDFISSTDPFFIQSFTCQSVYI